MLLFEHDGFKFDVNIRPDLGHLRQVYGHRESDDKCFMPKLLFEQSIPAEEIKEVCVSILDKTLNNDNIEVHGDYYVYVGN